MSNFHCEIVTPSHLFFEGDANFVVLPGKEGEIGVYAQHEPYVVTLKEGCVRVKQDDNSTEQLKFAVAGGFAQISSNKVIILAKRAVAYDDIDRDKALKKKEELASKLDALEPNDNNAAFIRSEIEWNTLLCNMK